MLLMTLTNDYPQETLKQSTPTVLSSLKRLRFSADAAHVSKEAADEAGHAETNGAAADVSGDDMDSEDMNMGEEGNSGGVTAAGEVSSQPAVLSISVAPDR